ncbi:hypothetical protein ACEQPO_19630 [Bacillus sp. SL00103]
MQTKYFAQQGYGQKQIASNLKVHPFRVKLAMDQARLFFRRRAQADCQRAINDRL